MRVLASLIGAFLMTNTEPVPKRFPVIPDAIPQEMKVLPHWVVWRFEVRDGKSTKIPYSPRGFKAKANDPRTWGTFEETLNVLERGGFDGVGFQFTNSGFTGIDLDHKQYGEGVHPLSEAILTTLDTYSEITPSGKGQHAILRGTLPEWAINRKQLADDLEIEVYSTGRFFTVTGDLLQSPFIESRQQELEALLIEWGMVKAVPLTRDASTGQTATFTGSDSELWDRIFSSSSGSQVRALADGDMSRYEGDHSRADFAMCGHLAFWTNGNPERMDSMFRSTALMRPKWDSKHRSDGTTYGQMTIAEVLNRWDGEGYDPTRKKGQQEAEQQTWSAPEVLMRGRQHLASSGSHGRTVNSYSTLWQAVVGVAAEGFTTREGDTLTVSSFGMTELYARAGGRLVDRRQQLKFLQAQGMCGPLIRQDPANPRSAWLLTLPANPAQLPMWLARGSLPALPVNPIRRPNTPPKPLSPVIKDYGSIKPFPESRSEYFPFWTVFSLSILGEATSAEIADLARVSSQRVRRHLTPLPTISTKTGRVWKSVLTPVQVGELHAHLTAPEVERRRRKMLEARLEFHEQKAEVLAAQGLRNQALFHFRYAERYRRHLGEAA